MLRHELHHARRLRAREQRIRERRREELVRPDAEIASTVGRDHVVQRARALVPERGEERLARSLGEPARLRGLLLRAAARLDVAEHAARIVPERVDLHRLPAARRDHAAVHARVHPRERQAVGALRDESIGILADPEVGAGGVGEHDRFECRAERSIAHRRIAARGAEMVQRHREPEARVHGVVLGRAAAVGESIRQQPVPDVRRECRERPRGVIDAIGGARETGQRDHRIAPPIAEPRITRDHRYALGPALHGERIRGHGETARERVALRRRRGERGAALHFRRLERIRGGRRLVRRGIDEIARPARRERELQHERRERILARRESALEFAQVLELPEPLRVVAQLRVAIVQRERRAAGGRCALRARRARGDAQSPPVGHAAPRMMVAAHEEGAHRQRARRPGQQPVAHHGACSRRAA